VVKSGWLFKENIFQISQLGASKIFCTYLFPCFLLENMKRIVYQTSNVPLTFQKKWFFFPISIFSLFLTFKSNLCHIIWTWKNTPRISPKISPIFEGLGMILVIKTNLINQKNNIIMFTTSILKCLKKKTKYLQKHFTYFQVFELYFSNCHKFLGQFKYLQVA
jgi:hypothetical protein